MIGAADADDRDRRAARPADRLPPSGTSGIVVDAKKEVEIGSPRQ